MQWAAITPRTTSSGARSRIGTKAVPPSSSLSAESRTFGAPPERSRLGSRSATRGMASRVMEMVHAVCRRSVGLLNVGEEAEKGGRMQQAAHELLEGAKDLYFYGNVGGREVVHGNTEICLTDGFTGNVLAKGMEGVV